MANKSWLDENKDRGRHPPKDAESDLLDLLRSQYREWDYRKMWETAEKIWEANQKLMGRDRLAGDEITSRMFVPEAEHFTLPNGQPAVRFKPPARYTFGIDLAAPISDQTKVFIPGIESLRPSEDPEIRIKVRKHKLKFNFNN